MGGKDGEYERVGSEDCNWSSLLVLVVLNFRI